MPAPAHGCWDSSAHVVCASVGLGRQEAGEAPAGRPGAGGWGPGPATRHLGPSPSPGTTLTPQLPPQYTPSLESSPCPGWAPRQPGTVPGSPPSSGSRVGRTQSTEDGAGRPGHQQDLRPGAGGPEGEGTPSGRRVGALRAAGPAAGPRSRPRGGGALERRLTEEAGTKEGSARQLRPTRASLPACPQPASLPAGAGLGSERRTRVQGARQERQIPSRAVATGPAARSRRKGRSEAGPEAVKEKNIPRPANCCSQLFSPLLLLRGWWGGGGEKKAALPLEADAKRMQNFNHLLHRPSFLSRVWALAWRRGTLGRERPEQPIPVLGDAGKPSLLCTSIQNGGPAAPAAGVEDGRRKGPGAFGGCTSRYQSLPRAARLFAGLLLVLNLVSKSLIGDPSPVLGGGLGAP